MEGRGGEGGESGLVCFTCMTQRGFPGKHYGSTFLLHLDGITRSVRFELGLQRGQLFPREIEPGKRRSAPILLL